MSTKWQIAEVDPWIQFLPLFKNLLHAPLHRLSFSPFYNPLKRRIPQRTRTSNRSNFLSIPIEFLQNINSQAILTKRIEKGKKTEDFFTLL
jgi:hypothetical protein